MRSTGLRSRVGKMKKLLLRRRRRGHSLDNIHTDIEPGVRLWSFQSLDLDDGQSEDPVQEWGEEVEDGAVFGITLRREPAPPQPVVTMETSREEPRPPPGPPASGFILYQTVKVRRLKAGTLERLVTHLLDTEHREADFTRVFLSTYKAFTSSRSLIEMLFEREDLILNLDTTVCLRSPLLPVIKLWLQDFSEDLYEPPEHPALRLLCGHLRPRLCFRRLARTAETLLKKFQERAGASCRDSTSSEQNGDEGPEEDYEGPEEDSGDRLGFMDFPAKDVAEQLTRLDADLFVRAVPFHCLGCVWSQRDKKENRHLAPTVRATIAQFNAVTNRVITSLLLCPPAVAPTIRSPPAATSSPLSSPVSRCSSPHHHGGGAAPPAPRSPCSSHHTSPAHRAHVIERWISIAQECRTLKNFSSLKAILSALQSNAVYRLKKTWAAVSRESMAVFDQLCETFPDENCVLTSREFLVEDGTQTEDHMTSDPRSPKPCPIARQLSSSGGIVPYLGTYLTVLTMLDTALTDVVEGGLINFEKRRREFEILSHIRHLQGSCSQYSLPVNPDITTWIQAHTLLSDQESYELSRGLEPPTDPCPSSPSLWSHRLLAKKQATARPASESSASTRRTTHCDQISVSSSGSSGSSGSEMEDLSSPQPSPLRLKLQSLSGSLHNVAEDFSSCSASSSSPSPSMTSCCSSSQPDLSSLSLVVLSPADSSSLQGASLQGSSLQGSSLQASFQASLQASLPPYNRQVALPLYNRQVALPLYNRQVADSCIIRVSVESENNGNVYKSILLTSQDHTPQVIQRALEKHNMEAVSCHDFSLSQVLNQDRELQIPDKANVFYAMCTSANYDFILRQQRSGRGYNHGRHLATSSSPGTQAKGRQAR